MKIVAIENLKQLREMLEIIEEDNYTHKADILSGSSIGQHVRHILEFYLILVSGSFTGTVSYDKRQRDIRIEESPQFAIKTIGKLLPAIETLDEDMVVNFEGDFTSDGSSKGTILSSIRRELAYCVEHSIHHQALIKAALIAHGLKELTTDNFGVAYSTIRFRNN